MVTGPSPFLATRNFYCASAHHLVCTEADTMAQAFEKRLYCEVDLQGDSRQGTHICLHDPGLGENLNMRGGAGWCMEALAGQVLPGGL